MGQILRYFFRTVIYYHTNAVLSTVFCGNIETIFHFNEKVYNAFPALELDESILFKTDMEWGNNRSIYPYWLYFLGCYDIWKWNGMELSKFKKI